MSFKDRPQAWCTPMGLFAVIGPSRKDQRGPSAVCARSLSNTRFSSQKRRISRSIAGKSGTLGTGRYMFFHDNEVGHALACLVGQAVSPVGLAESRPRFHSHVRGVQVSTEFVRGRCLLFRTLKDHYCICLLTRAFGTAAQRSRCLPRRRMARWFPALPMGRFCLATTVLSASTA